MIGHFADAAAETRFRAVYDRAMALLPAPAGATVVPTDFGRVHVHRFGDDPRTPLVLLPGRAGNTTMWEPNLPAWAAHRTVLAVEALGEAGLSVQEREIRDAGDQAAWLGATLDGLGLERAHLVGVSFGGWLATNLALHGHPAVASLSLVDPAYVFGRFPPAVVLASLATLPATPAFVRNRMLSWISGGAPVEDEPVAAVIAAAMREYRLGVPPPVYPSDAALRGLRVPALVLIAGRSRIHHPRKAYERARAQLPDAQVELWPQASHAITGECAAQVNERILGFTDAVDGKGPP